MADIHANLAAFQAVLDDIEKQGGVDDLWCLGDIVGYGPDPHECIELLRSNKHICVAGNHDWSAIGKIATSDFNPEAASAASWTAYQLSRADKKYLENLPIRIEKGDFTLVHGSPRDPIWEYLMSEEVAGDNLLFFASRYCLVGHSHIPLFYECIEGRCSAKRLRPENELTLGDKRLIVNPGGVGQPRDGDPRAGYAIYNSDTGVIKPFRVDYDFRVTQERMARFGMPQHLISRLADGF